MKFMEVALRRCCCIHAGIRTVPRETARSHCNPLLSRRTWPGIGTSALVSALALVGCDASPDHPVTAKAAAVAQATLLATAQTIKVSVRSDGGQADSWSENAKISADGLHVVFESPARNLVDGDLNGVTDVFVHDIATGITERVSVSTTGIEANGDSRNASISADGRYVAFESTASTLAANTELGRHQIYVRDRWVGITELVSRAADGSPADQTSSRPDISADGRYVAFESVANNLIANKSLTNRSDIYVYDRIAEKVILASVDSAGNQAGDVAPPGVFRYAGSARSASISGSGRYVAFLTDANFLVGEDGDYLDDVYVHDIVSGHTERVSQSASNSADVVDEPRISANGRYVAFVTARTLGDRTSTDSRPDVFVFDRETGETERVSVATDGTEGDWACESPAVSGDGRFVAFESTSNNLIPGKTSAGRNDVYVRDRLLRTTTLITTKSDGSQLVSSSDQASISAGGRYVAFRSVDQNLVEPDTNGATDIFVRDTGVHYSVDTDKDSVPDDIDNCPSAANAMQENTDGDAFGDVCDPVPSVPEPIVEEPPAAEPIDWKWDGECTPADRHLVLVTHGWLPDSMLEPAWVNEMAGEILRRIPKKDVCNWDVFRLDWAKYSHTLVPVPRLAFWLADDVAAANFPAFQGKYRYVHLIGHSAGSRVIDELAVRFNKDSPRPSIQETFLDAYHPNGNENEYGCPADFADSYVDMRSGGGFLDPTNLTLTGALNIDVTALDKDQSDGLIEPHQWPYQWYASTIVASPPVYGYGYSLESGRTALPSFGVDGSSTGRGGRICLVSSSETGTCGPITTGPEPLAPGECVHQVTSVVQVNGTNGHVTGVETSDTGEVTYEAQTGKLTLGTGSPGWQRFTIQLPSSINALSFKYQFLDAAPANGLLSVSLDNQIVFSRRQSLAGAGTQESGIVPLGTVQSGTHQLTFRIDPLSATKAHVHIDSITLGNVGTAGPTSSAPSIAANVTGVKGEADWYTSNVVVTWSIDSHGQQLTSTTGCSDASVTTDTSGLAFNCTAVSGAGSTTQSITVKRDATPPSIAVDSPIDGSTIELGASVAARFDCVDATSGIATCLGTTNSGQSIDTSSAGPKSLTISATDTAGNTASREVTYTVKKSASSGSGGGGGGALGVDLLLALGLLVGMGRRRGAD